MVLFQIELLLLIEIFFDHLFGETFEVYLAKPWLDSLFYRQDHFLMLFHVFVVDRMNILGVIMRHRQKLMNDIMGD